VAFWLFIILFRPFYLPTTITTSPFPPQSFSLPTLSSQLPSKASEEFPREIEIGEKITVTENQKRISDCDYKLKLKSDSDFA